MKSILTALFVLIFSFTAYSSNDNHLFLKASDFSLELRWAENISEFDNPANSFGIIKLFASNYENLSKKDGSVSVYCFRKKDKINIFYNLNKEKAVKKSFTSIGELEKFIIEKIKTDIKIEDSADNSFILYCLAVIVDRDNPFFPNLTNLSGVYFGAAPGIMQEVANKNLYYKYYFLNCSSLTSVLDKMKNLKGVIIKKEVFFKDSDKMFKIFDKKK